MGKPTAMFAFRMIEYMHVNNPKPGIADVSAFLGILDVLGEHPLSGVRDLFDPQGELVVTRAPGRLDLMGGIADYSGSLVLQWPIREAARVALQRRPDRILRIVSLGSPDEPREPVFEMPMADLEQDGWPLSYATARAYFQKDSRTHWAAYIAGAFLVLRREKQAVFADGASLLIDSAVPEGKGVSSSAAIEVAAMQAIATAYDITLKPHELALLCQKVENLVAGAPCGVMDQMTAACGQEGRLLSLLCQPAELKPSVPVPEGVAFWGLDSGVRHAVSGADYTSVRIGAFMGYRIIADLDGLEVEPSRQTDRLVHIDDPKWRGHLANIGPACFERYFAARLPEKILGRDFLDRYSGTTDPVTQIDPERTYAVRVPTAHPVYEHFRVCAFQELLGGKCTERALELMGELMYQSHVSYSACGLGCADTDRLVDLVRQAGPQKGLYGAKITGGGSGGTVAVLGRPKADTVIHEIAERYAQATDHRPHVFSGSSPGAAAFGFLRLKGCRH